MIIRRRDEHFNVGPSSCRVGFHVGDWGYVHNVLTDVRVRGQGHGTRLMEQVCAWADSEGLDLVLECRPALVVWYSRFGFEDHTLDSGALRGHRVLRRQKKVLDRD